METRPLISIIIPVYNAGDKLNHCIHSLLSQSYQNFEIILVDDKSPDLNTLKLEEEWVEKDRRIKLLENVINGEHEPRLWGMREAKGSYICFSDQDDWLPKNSLEVMLNAAKKNDVDVVIGQTSKVIKVGPFYKEFPENVTGGKVLIKKFVQIGAHSLVFPNLIISEGCVIGACSMLRKDTEPWGVYYGIPALLHGVRKRELLKFVY